MAYTDHTWASGLVSVSDANTFIRDNFRYLFTGREGMMVYGTSGQAFTTSTPAKVLHTTTYYDNGGMSYASGDITVTNNGIYTLNAGIACAGAGTWAIVLFVDGTRAAVGEGIVLGAAASTTVQLSAGAVVTSQAQTTSGATISTQGLLPYLGVQRVA